MEGENFACCTEESQSRCTGWIRTSLPHRLLPLSSPSETWVCGLETGAHTTSPLIPWSIQGGGGGGSRVCAALKTTGFNQDAGAHSVHTLVAAAALRTAPTKTRRAANIFRGEGCGIRRPPSFARSSILGTDKVSRALARQTRFFVEAERRQRVEGAKKGCRRASATRLCH
jgi:hypothetical protein